MERRRPLRPLAGAGRRLQPQARFLWQRLTPGGLGLELTTLLAALAVGLFVLIAYWSIVAGDPGPTPGDQTALDVANDIQVGWLDDLAKAITRSAPATSSSRWPCWRRGGAGAHAALGGARRCWSAALRSRSSSLVDLIKDATDRPRPPGRPGRLRRLRLSQRPRGLLDLLHLARGDGRCSGSCPDDQARPADRRGDRRHRPGRPLPRLPRRPLAQRRQRRLGAGRLRLLAAAAVALVSLHIRDNLRPENADDGHNPARERDPCSRSATEY